MKHDGRFFALHLMMIASLALWGCSSTGSHRTAGTSPYDTPTGAMRDTVRAQELNQSAAKQMDEGDYEKAEVLLRDSLTADLFFGPAHNNLGVIHLDRGNLYEAAHEFEWARKLMPGHPDPRLNLALTMERAGRIDEAIANCRSALEAYPGHIQSIQQLARLQLRHNRRDEGTADLLSEVALRGETPEWREWAREQVNRH